MNVGRAGVRIYCSADCLDAALHGWPDAPDASPRRVEAGDIGRKVKVSRGALFAIGLGIASLSPCARVQSGAGVQPASMLPTPGQPAALDRSGFIGPPAPNDEELAMEFMSELGGERWIHPLPGPVRRMPIRNSRVFGAAREGDRPGECRSGHCGVDIGGDMWGETVYAVADGVVDRVKRDPEGSGGMYVRVAHRSGKLFTQYFHLAAIPRNLAAGDHVSAGEVIGLVGDTGVRHSTAHLHFTVSVRPTEHSKEIYMDPEPLIALWPLKVPKRSGGADAAWDPGVPLGAAGRPRADRGERPAKKQRHARRSKKSADDAEDTAGTGAPEPAASQPDESSAEPAAEPTAEPPAERAASRAASPDLALPAPQD